MPSDHEINGDLFEMNQFKECSLMHTTNLTLFMFLVLQFNKVYDLS